MAELDLVGLRAAYAAELAAVDPLLPEPGELAAPPGEAGPVLRAHVGGSMAVGATSFEALDPESLMSAWGALRQHRMRVQVAGPDPAAAFGALLRQWRDHVSRSADPGDDDSVAMVTWPSRLSRPVIALTRNDFSPGVVVAVARTDDATPVERPGVRPLHEDDVDAAMVLYEQLMEYDSRFGAINTRPSTAARLRETLESVLARADGSSWVFERDGRIAGLCYLDLPEHAEWVAGQVRGGPVAYLGCLVVDEAARGGGIGAALVARAHSRAAAAGATTTLLHHGAINPLSTPFWYRCGYRPLWTVWQRRPALSAE